MPATLWQLYGADGNPIAANGATLWDASLHALLHGAAHVWVWRPASRGVEVLTQTRAANKFNWPGKLNKSAGGHILLGENPTSTAVRKLKYELGVETAASELEYIGRHRWQAVIAGTDLKENEYQWVYLLRHDYDDFVLTHDDVEYVSWKSLDTFAQESVGTDSYVPYGQDYYEMVCATLRQKHESAPSRRKLRAR